MNKLSKEVKEFYIEYYKILELEQKGESLEEDLPIDSRRITLMVLRNLKTIIEYEFNDILVQYYYLGLTNKYLKDKKEMTSKEVQVMSRQTRMKYSIERFIVNTF